MDAKDKVSARTRLSFGYGCIGRDAAYTLVSTFIMTYLTLAVGLADWQLLAIGVVMVVARVWDAVNDPMMGTIIDNTNTKWGKFKPYILIGSLLNSIFIVLLFTNYGAVNEVLFVVIFAFTYILWGMTYTMNDISYWSMLPSLTLNQKEREKVSSLARIGANLGLFIITAVVPMVTQMGNMQKMYNLLAIIVACVFVACQILVVCGVQEKKNAIVEEHQKTRLRDLFKVITQNDQLMAIIVSILIFNIGYFITTGFGMQFFYFDYGVYGGMEFTYFALTIGVAQIATLALYPVISKGRTRRQLFGIAIAMVVVGYLGFMGVGYVLPMNMISLCIIGFILFSGQAIIQLLNYVLLADTVEYGQWKLGRRNESITFSLNPFVTKLAGAVQAGVFSITMVVSGLNAYSNQISAMEQSGMAKEEVLTQANALVATIPAASTLVMRLSMIIVPLLLILCSYVIYLKKYKIDDKMYAQIVSDLAQRAEEKAKA